MESRRIYKADRKGGVQESTNDVTRRTSDAELRQQGSSAVPRSNRAGTESISHTDRRPSTLNDQGNSKSDNYEHTATELRRRRPPDHSETHAVTKNILPSSNPRGSGTKLIPDFPTGQVYHGPESDDESDERQPKRDQGLRERPNNRAGSRRTQVDEDSNNIESLRRGKVVDIPSVREQRNYQDTPIQRTATERDHPTRNRPAPAKYEDDRVAAQYPDSVRKLSSTTVSKPAYTTTKSNMEVRNASKTGSESNTKLPTMLGPGPIRSVRTDASIESKNPQMSIRTQGASKPETAIQDDNNPFTVLTSSLSKHFALINPNRFDHYANFVEEFPEVLDEDYAKFVKEAVQLFKLDEDALAMGCVQCSVLIHSCGDFRTLVQKQRYLRRLEENGSDAEDFKQKRRKLSSACKEKAQEKGETQRPRRLTDDKRSSQQVDPIETQDDKLENLTMELASLDERIIWNQTVEPIESQDPDLRKRDIVRTLNSRYAKQNGSFFIPGKVFSLLWHEAAGEANKGKISINLDRPYMIQPKNNPNLTEGPLGQSIFSHIRRMVVIRNRKGYCWCVSVNTYKGRALTKPGLSKEEREAHAIIYDQDRTPETIDKEKRPSKRSIAVKLVKGQSLDRASRINFAKPFPVEWNVKVSEVGQVAPESMVHLVNYAKLEIFGSEPTEANTSIRLRAGKN